MSKQKTSEKIMITEETVKHVANLARLELSVKEIRQMKMDLNEILSAFKDLDKLSIRKIKPSFHPTSVVDVFRDDVIENPIDQGKALSNTKHKENGYFKGPKAV